MARSTSMPASPIKVGMRSTWPLVMLIPPGAVRQGFGPSSGREPASRISASTAL
jgi:hypothetical protein